MQDANLRVLDDPELPRRRPGTVQHFIMVVMLMLIIACGLILLAGF